LAKQLAQGVEHAGGDPHTFFLHEMQIAPCNACNACIKHPEGGCVIQDDMQSLYPELAAAQAVVFASPVYWFNYAAQLKLFIDRTYAVQDHDDYALTGKKIGIILTYADVDEFHAGGVNALRSLQDMCRFVRAEIAGIVHGSADKPGDIQSRPELIKQAYDLGQKLVIGSKPD
jgi:multimeric flavodoxin WrbA